MSEKDRIIGELKKHGKRMTGQRKLILDIILDGHCRNCKEIYYEAVKLDPGIGVATVYRMMSMLEEIGAVYKNNSYDFAAPQSEEESEETLFLMKKSGEKIQLGPEIAKEIYKLLEKSGY